MKINWKHELPVLLIAMVPSIFLFSIWKELPEKVPMHWNFQGEIDRYGNKNELIWFAGLLPFFTYFIFQIIPVIDPKGKIKNMGNKFQSLKLILTVFMSALSIFIILSAKNQFIGNSNYIFMIIGLLFAVLGNYFQAIKPNYFIGIRTPWALENEPVWKKTHALGGKLWLVGGILIVALAFLIRNNTTYFIIFSVITAIICIIPVVYSYVQYKKLEKEAE